MNILSIILTGQNEDKYSSVTKEEKLDLDVDIFEAETDVDEDDLISQNPVSSPPSNIHCSKKNRDEASQSTKKEKVTSVGDILNTMPFLDPTIPL